MNNDLKNTGTKTSHKNKKKLRIKKKILEI